MLDRRGLGWALRLIFAIFLVAFIAFTLTEVATVLAEEHTLDARCIIPGGPALIPPTLLATDAPLLVCL